MRDVVSGLIPLQSQYEPVIVRARQGDRASARNAIRSAGGVLQEGAEPIGIEVFIRIAGEEDRVAPSGVTAGLCTLTPVGWIDVIGIRCRINQDQAESASIGTTWPGGFIPITEITNGAIGGILKLDSITPIVEARSILKLSSGHDDSPTWREHRPRKKAEVDSSGEVNSTQIHRNEVADVHQLYELRIRIRVRRMIHDLADDEVELRIAWIYWGAEGRNCGRGRIRQGEEFTEI